MSDDELLGNDALGNDEYEAPASEEEEQASETDAEEAELSEEDSDEEGEAEGEEDEEGDDDGDESSELEEVEFRGKKYKLHPDLKPALMMQADYTRKTQEVAEEKRALEEQKETLSQQAEAQKELVNEYGQLHAIKAQIAQYANVDWNQWDDQDPIEAGKHYRHLHQLKEAASQIEGEIRNKENERSQAAQQEAAKRTEEYLQSLRKEIPDWSNELDFQLTNYARGLGFSDQDLKSVRDVRMVKILREAMEGRQLKEKLQKQQQAAKKPKPKEEVKPLKKQAKGRTSARSGLSDDMSTEEWVKQRNKQVAARQRY